MANLKMKKLIITGLKSESERVVSALSKTRILEISKNEDGGEIKDNNLAIRHEAITAKMEKLSLGLDIINECIKELDRYIKKTGKEEAKAKKKGVTVEKFTGTYKKEKKPFMGGRRIVTEHELDTIESFEYELLDAIEQLEKNEKRYEAITAEIEKKKALLKEVSVYNNLDINFSAINSLKYSFAFIGTAALNRYDAIAALRDKFPDCSITIEQNNKSLIVFATGLDQPDELADALIEAGFEKNTFDFDASSDDKAKEIKAEIIALNNEYRDMLAEMGSYTEKRKEIELFYDYLMVSLEKVEAVGALTLTEQTFALEGFFPAYAEERIKNAVYNVTSTVDVVIRDATEGDNPPTLLKNRPWIAPYESITNMYSPPAHKEFDPNVFVAFFYFMFFGMMIGDAGYGLILSIICFLIVGLCRVEKGMKQILLIFGMGGISTIIWGLLFGGIFGITSIKPLWFNPIKEPILFLGIALAVGFIQIMVGLGIKGYKLIRKGKPFSALFDVGSLYALFGGIGCLVLGMLNDNPMLKKVGLIMLICAVGVMILTQGRKKPSIPGKIMGGFGSLYGLINYISDILSYSRIFGLGLAGAVIGMVANILATMVIGIIPIVGYVVAAVILFVFHALNLVIGLISTYVHNARLQFIEFFNKFYDGDGRLFSPFGVKTKYTRLDNGKKK